MVEIKIMGDTPLEALSSLTAFGMHCMTNEKVLDAANRILEAEQQSTTNPPAATDKPAEPPAIPDTPEPPPDPTPAPGPAAGESGQTAAPTDQRKPEPFPTAEAVRAKGIEAAKRHGNEAVKQILGEFHVTGMSALAEQDRAAFLARLESLGGGDA